MAESKKEPELFKANLFSPAPSPGSLSFGLANDSFNSSFSLAPALTTPASAQSSSPPAPKKEETKTTVQASSVAKTEASWAGKTTPISSVATPTPSAAELSTVPLDSPPPSSGEVQSPPPPPLAVTPHRPLQPPVGPGWNDPPLKTTPPPPPPGSDVGTADTYSIQPLAGQPDTPQATPIAPPPGVSVSQQVSANPYRLGQGGGKRVAYGGGGGGVASYPPRQPAPPTSLPPTTYTPDPAKVEITSTNQEVGVVPVGVVEGVCYHWFYLRPNERYWIPFSLADSAILEHTWTTTATSPDQVLVPTDGGRYDVDLQSRTRTAIYWNEPASLVRHCSWFYKGDGDRWYMPYTEEVAVRLEEAYVGAVVSGVWGERVEVGEGEGVVMHSQTSMAHYAASQFQPITHEVDYTHPHSVLRGFAELDHVEQGEQSRIDHLVFVVHSIGEHHDLSFRCLVDCVDDFREVSQLMLKTHRFTGQAPRAGDSGGRVEFLPVHWHAALHGDSMGVDAQLQRLSLNSISRLRGFTNSTLLDILFYTSPVYFQTIVDQVAGEMNRMYELFLQRNLGFTGRVSVMGHSLGSCILFDILSHQTGVCVGESGLPEEPLAQEDIDQPSLEMAEDDDEEEEEEEMPTTLEEALSLLGLDSLINVFLKEQIDFDSLLMISDDDLKELGLAMGPRKKLSSFISNQGDKIRAAKEKKAHLEAERKAREREMARQQQSGNHATLQGVKIVKGVAGTGQPYVVIPQLKFKTENLFALGSPIGLFLVVRGVEELGPDYSLPHCHQIFNIFHPFDPVAYRLEPLVSDPPPDKPVLMPHHKGRKRFHLELYETVEQVGASMRQYVVEGMRNMWQQLNELARSHRSPTDQPPSGAREEEEPDTPSMEAGQQVVEQKTGQLNRGRRIDYVLQEKPIEKLNQYLFALSSHLSYWRSEDTALFLLKEVYEEMTPELIKS